MSSRYITNVLVALFGGFVVVATRSFGAPTVGWIGLAFGIAVVALCGLAQLDTFRGVLQRAIDLGLVALGGLTIGFGLAASGPAQVWTVFAFALGWVTLAVAALTVHEIGNWRARAGLATLHWFPTPTTRAASASASERPRAA